MSDLLARMEPDELGQAKRALECRSNAAFGERIGVSRQTIDGWATPKENCADKLKHGTHRAGEHHPNATLSAGAVRNIRKLSGMGFSPREIAELTGRHQKQISNVVYGYSWKCVA